MRLGADPEVFLKKGTKHISVVGLVKGNKWNPFQVPYLPRGFTLQQDNVALEFGIPPAANKGAFIDYIQEVMRAGKQHTKLTYSKESCAIFDEDQMQTAEAHTFGCEPDYNAWTGKANPQPKPGHKFMRSAGGHVHVETQFDKTLTTRALDLYLGVPSVLMDDGEERKQMYGKAGAHRPKKYGVEYRTLSNFWIFSKKHIGWVWDQTERALTEGFKEYEQDGKLANHLEMFPIQKCIDTNDKKLAEKLVKEFNLSVV
jgi:hypothetical protein